MKNANTGDTMTTPENIDPRWNARLTGTLDKEGQAVRAQKLQTIADAIGWDKVNVAMSDPKVLGLMNFVCQGVADQRRGLLPA